MIEVKSVRPLYVMMRKGHRAYTNSPETVINQWVIKCIHLCIFGVEICLKIGYDILYIV